MKVKSSELKVKSCLKKLVTCHLLLVTGKRGFTLIELVMIIVLLGILAAVAIPRFYDIGADAKQNVTTHRLEELRKAIVGNPDAVGSGTYSARGFRGDVGSFPAALNDLVDQGGYPAWNRYTKTGWNGPYVSASGGEYLLDAWGRAFIYDAGSNPPTITSYGANGVSGGGDDIVVELRY
ncbi:MAG: type II secretion system protein GspG [Thermodesulfovibrionales bacterium]|nr:type II secretion system protein GspG [Thermodesulfovibrionales bacterium]